MRSRLIKALNNRFYVKFMQLEIGLLRVPYGVSRARWVKVEWTMMEMSQFYTIVAFHERKIEKLCENIVLAGNLPVLILRM